MIQSLFLKFDLKGTMTSEKKYLCKQCLKIIKSIYVQTKNYHLMLKDLTFAK